MTRWIDTLRDNSFIKEGIVVIWRQDVSQGTVPSTAEHSRMRNYWVQNPWGFLDCLQMPKYAAPSHGWRRYKPRRPWRKTELRQKQVGTWYSPPNSSSIMEWPCTRKSTHVSLAISISARETYDIAQGEQYIRVEWGAGGIDLWYCHQFLAVSPPFVQHHVPHVHPFVKLTAHDLWKRRISSESIVCSEIMILETFTLCSAKYRSICRTICHFFPK